jgi:glutamate synthase domain-containing protein 3
MTTATDIEVVDLATTTVRELNQRLHDAAKNGGPSSWRIVNPKGAHAMAVGIDAPFDVEIVGHTGYYAAGMNKHATVRIDGNAGVGVGENIMSGEIRISGNASQACAATGRGGLVVVDGDAAARCGISMKGVEIVGFVEQGNFLLIRNFVQQAIHVTWPEHLIQDRDVGIDPDGNRRALFQVNIG